MADAGAISGATQNLSSLIRQFGQSALKVGDAVASRDGDLAEAIVQMKLDSHAVKAAASAVKAEDDLIEDLLNILA